MQDTERQYTWDARFQQEILAMLIADRVFLTQSLTLIRPSYFIDRAHELICDIVFKYFTQCNVLPPRFFIETEIRERCKDEGHRFMYLSELRVLTESYAPALMPREVVLDKITEFAREQALRSAVADTFTLLQKNPEGKWDQIRELFRKALSVDRNFDLGLDYFNTVQARFERMQAAAVEQEVFVTGFDKIDYSLTAGGLCRGEIGSFVGCSGTGKSLLLVKTAVQNLVRGKKVLYLTLEMDQDKIARRFDAQLVPMSIKKVATATEEVRQQLEKALAEHLEGYEDRRRLIIKQFPPGTATVDTFRAYMAQLGLHGFKPDLVCVDYVGEMRNIPALKTYESLQYTVRDLRGFGVEEGHCTFTAMQPNRRGREIQSENEAGLLDEFHLADSAGMFRVLDAGWSINQTIAEKKAGVARMFVMKHRDGESRHDFPVRYNLETLDIYQISDATFGDLMSRVHKEAEKETAEAIPSKRFRQNAA